MKKKNKKITMIIIFIFILLMVFAILNRTIKTIASDGMDNIDTLDISYRAMYSGKWTDWITGGNACGNVKANKRLEKIEFRIRDKNKKGTFSYSYYLKNKKWSDPIPDEKKAIIKNATALSFALNSVLNKKYEICYRTHSKKYGWLEWSCDDEINGTKDENINSFSVKIIPKKVIKKEYLKDYEIKPFNKKNIGF